MYILKNIIQKYGLNAKKSLGQNFILDGNLLDKIARMSLAGVDFDTLLEIGPGPGGLTQALLNNSNSALYVIEKDDRCVRALQELAFDFPERLNILNEDALKFSEENLSSKICLVANLPYNISTVLLLKWLKKINLFSSLTLMFQKEVADRLVASEKDNSYGRLSVLTQWLVDVYPLMTLSPQAFSPPPKVKSSLVRLVPKKNPATGFEFTTLERLTAAAFGQRRKMLRSSLKTLALSAEQIEQLCASAEVSTSQRAEEVSVQQFCTMAKWIENNV